MNTVSPDKTKKRKYLNVHIDNGRNTVIYDADDPNIPDDFDGFLLSFDINDIVENNDDNDANDDISRPKHCKTFTANTSAVFESPPIVVTDELCTFDETRASTPPSKIMDNFDMLTSSAFNDNMDIATRHRHNNRIKELMGAVKKDYKKNVEVASKRLKVYRNNMFAPNLLEYLDKSTMMFKGHNDGNNATLDQDTYEYKKNLYLLQAQAHYLNSKMKDHYYENSFDDEDDEEVKSINYFNNHHYRDQSHDVIALPIARRKDEKNKWI